ncbi:MAG: hypothetical protein OXC37_03610 [Bdellovibrionaceae bacterium]|nr:hypothetical protein [Pseudobdellovibrionaceae bacterium]
MINNFLFAIAFLFFNLFSFSAVSKVSPTEYLKKVSKIIERGDYLLGSRELYRLGRGSYFKKNRVQIKYTLGIAFLEMKLYHLASLQFVYVIRNDKRGKYKGRALEKLSFILDYFKGDLLFCPLINEVKEYDYPNSVKSQLSFYFGKCAFSKKNFRKARSYFSKVSSSSPIYDRALYYKALSYAEENKVNSSANAFRQLASLKIGITDTNRVAALMGLARVLYQGEKFDDSIQVYRSIPKDTPYFYDSLLENSWNYLRSGKFRSALSNFQSLHSIFYGDRYQPESLILRAYVYLYICKYYEMEKVLNFFNAIYKPILNEVTRSLKGNKNYNSYVKSALTYVKNKQDGFNLSNDETLPKPIMEKVLKNDKFYSLINYLVKLNQEKDLLDSFPAEWKRDRVGRNAYYILNRRIKTTQNTAGKEIYSNLRAVKSDLERLYTSSQYLKYDMLKGKRDYLKKKISRKYLDKIQIDEKITRSYYIQNGYEYWPFDGEAWLDELGNYHYLGRQNCE